MDGLPSTSIPNFEFIFRKKTPTPIHFRSQNFGSKFLKTSLKFTCAGIDKWLPDLRAMPTQTVPVITMWQRFLDTLAGLLGRPKKYAQAIEKIISVNTAIQARNAAEGGRAKLKDRIEFLMEEMYSGATTATGNAQNQPAPGPSVRLPNSSVAQAKQALCRTLETQARMAGPKFSNKSGLGSGQSVNWAAAQDQSHAQTVERVARKSQPGAPEYRYTVVDPATQAGAPGRPQASNQQTGAASINDTVDQVARAFERAFGRRVVFVRPEGQSPSFFNGFIIPKSDPNVIYVNTDANVQLLSILGHEFFEGVVAKNPQLHDWIAVQAVRHLKRSGFGVVA